MQIHVLGNQLIYAEVSCLEVSWSIFRTDYVSRRNLECLKLIKVAHVTKSKGENTNKGST
jgi:hypothetical protein